jgi:hypothetical protein
MALVPEGNHKINKIGRKKQDICGIGGRHLLQVPTTDLERIILSFVDPYLDSVACSIDPAGFIGRASFTSNM